VLARAAIPAGTRVVVTTRTSEVHCSVTCSVDPGGGVGCQCRGLTPFMVLVFLRLVVVCRLTCLYPLLSFSVYRQSDEGIGRPSWFMLWDFCPLRLLIKALRTRNMRVWQ